MEIIFIDTETGTWGMASDLVVLAVSPSDIDLLEESSDSEINDFGKRHGTPVMGLLPGE